MAQSCNTMRLYTYNNQCAFKRFLTRIIGRTRAIRRVWTWKRENTQLCYNCWALWRGYKNREIVEESDGCPCCKLINVIMRPEETANCGNWYAIRLADIISDKRAKGPLLFFLELNFLGDEVFGMPVFISHENKEAHFLRHSCAQPAFSFDIPDQLNESLLRSWIDDCNTHGHARDMNAVVDRHQNTHTILLVDVQQKMLVRCPLLSEDKMDNYLALSYVWGSTNFFKTTNSNLGSLLLPGGLAEPHVSLPKTFQDAIKLVELIGLRYIWIDALCIVQDDQMKHDQLLVMNQIYGQAYMTIVCLAGNSAYFGLPGLNANTRMRRPWHVQFGQGHLYGALPNLGQAIRMSTHYTRAWTYQETFVSKRCLFVSEGQFFFRCSKSCHAESIDSHASLAPYSAIELGLTIYDENVSHERIFFDSVEQYTRRTLSYDEDIIDAFWGALQRMKQMGYRPRGDLTMDLISPKSLLWYPVDKDATRRLKMPNLTKTSLPTWSWTAWKGAITYELLAFGSDSRFYSLRWSHRYKNVSEDFFCVLEKDHGESQEPREFCAQPICSQLLDLPLGQHQPQDGRYAHFRPLSLYRFCASICTATNFAFHNWTSYVERDGPRPANVALLGIFNGEGKRCGVLFNPPELKSALSPRIEEVHGYLLIAVSMKKQYFWRENISTPDYDTKDGRTNLVNGCRCWLNVMLVKKSNDYEGVVERIAVGQMHPRAWVEANPTVATVTMM